MKLRFYQCAICGKVIAVMSGDNIPTFCCGEIMKELVPGQTDGAAEKHVPVFRMENNALHVQIGSSPHPMLEQHSILWIGLQSGKGFQFQKLRPGEPPEACFLLAPEDPVEAVFAFCDLHGLWKTAPGDK